MDSEPACPISQNSTFLNSRKLERDASERHRPYWTCPALIFLILLFAFHFTKKFLTDSALLVMNTCTTPPIRREWREISKMEQLAYLDAVSCLREKPSPIVHNGSLYDDFPYIHSRVGNYCKIEIFGAGFQSQLTK